MYICGFNSFITGVFSSLSKNWHDERRLNENCTIEARQQHFTTKNACVNNSCSVIRETGEILRDVALNCLVICYANNIIISISYPFQTLLFCYEKRRIFRNKGKYFRHLLLLPVTKHVVFWEQRRSFPIFNTIWRW